MIKFKATIEQVKEMCAKAVNAARPTGLGFIHFQANENFKPEDFECDELGFHLDYVQGRMTKLNIQKDGEGENIWKSRSFPPKAEYQSWVKRYPGNSLITDCGGEVCSTD